MTFATVDDVAAELGRDVPEDPVVVRQWQRWLDRAEAMIRARIPDLDARVASGTLATATVGSVQAAAVARLVRNPEGLRTSQVSVDDASTSRTTEAAVSTGELVVTGTEWSLLLGDSGAFSVRMGGSGPTVVRPDPWPAHRPRWP